MLKFQRAKKKNINKYRNNPIFIMENFASRKFKKK